MENRNQRLASYAIAKGITQISKFQERNKYSKRIISFLENYPPDEIISNIWDNWNSSHLQRKERRKTVLFRCELDALPIDEINTFEHRSVNNGVSHKCGHDGHIAILCGLAAAFSKTRNRNGNVAFFNLKKTVAAQRKF
jgi:metal-dependent amidase/aminoacylase/carboxypeptidase family protein